MRQWLDADRLALERPEASAERFTSGASLHVERRFSSVVQAAAWSTTHGTVGIRK